MLSRIKSWLRGMDRPLGEGRHLVEQTWPAAVYAIGDVHGCIDQLRRLEERIAADAESIAGDKLIVCLGDYVDRGPCSSDVLDHLTAPAPSGFRRICLSGNHETMMLSYLSGGSGGGWLEFGGHETLLSYGINAMHLHAASAHQRNAIIQSHIPNEHIEFLDGLPLLLSLPGVVFVHAGLRPNVPLEQQREDDLLWIRDEFFQAAPIKGRLVVHGHTPASSVVMAPGRICVDTGAFATGRLSAVRLTQHGSPQIIDTI